MLKSKSIFGILFAIGAGIIAFKGELDSQKQDKLIESLEKRITDLEQKETK